MNWTTEFPTKPGIYWVKNILWRSSLKYGGEIEPETRIAEIAAGEYDGSSAFVCYFPGNEIDYDSDNIAAAEWCGPIEPPV
jgi:hypothetical protein